MRNLFRFVILFLVPFLLNGCLFSKPQTQSVEPPVAVEEKKDLNLSYRQNLTGILRPYWDSGDFTGIKDQVLELTVPKDYLDLHFNIVLALEMLEQGRQDSDQSKIESGLDKLEGLKGEYAWLTETE